ncbi:MAG TPA: FAD-dependent oxidoreductase, partial [Firmicutes bacterium]|nr:FAD-dependent oxidoreductase [Bacillota bacterium]
MKKPRSKKPKSRKPKDLARVGVIVSQFEDDLSKVFDLGTLVRRIRRKVHVADVIVQPYPSTRRQIPGIARRFSEKGISRVVVIGCSERLYGKLFRDILADFNVARTMVEFADILTTRAPGKGRKADIDTALGVIDLAIARALTAVEPETISVDIAPSAVVIGGGIAGIAAAVGLASRGVEVKLVERNNRLGGRLNDLNQVFPTYAPAARFLEEQVAGLKQSGVEVLTGVEPVGLKGNVGSYRLELSNGSTLECGVIIVATGADLLTPTGLFGYGETPNVITQLELEGRLLRNEDLGSNIVMIQCVGSRNEERPYCSRICCTASIKNTITIKERFPNARITVLSRGIAEYAGDLDRAREMGVEIIRYSPARPPVVRESFVEVFDEISEMEAHIPFDLVVLAVPM